MNKEGGDNDWLMWKNDGVWSFLNSNDDLAGSEKKFSGDKLPNIRSDTCQPPISVKEMDEPTTFGRKRSSPEQKEDGKKKGKTKVGADGEGKSNHDIHIQTERERRKKMGEMLSELHGFLSQLSPKADKSTILDEAVSYIKILQNTLQKLEEQKQERLQAGMKLPSVGREQFLADQGSAGNSAAITPTNTSLLMNNVSATSFHTWSSPNMVLNICGEEAHISVYCPKKPAFFSTICYVLEKHNIEIVSAQLSSDHYRNMFMIQARARSRSSLDQFSEVFPVEEIYKQAATEIILFMSNL